MKLKFKPQFSEDNSLKNFFLSRIKNNLFDKFFRGNDKLYIIVPITSLISQQ